MDRFFVSVVMTIIQLSGTYLRYLPFSREISEKELSNLKKYFFLWTFADLTLNFILFSDGLTYRAYKIALFWLWVPYFLISVKIIRGKLPQHIFAFGMEGLWCFMLHSFGGMGVALTYGNMTEEFILPQMGFYLILFLVSLKLEREFFINLLPSSKLFAEGKSLKWYISIFPLAIFLGTVIGIIDVTFVTTWRERFSRLFFPIFFFLMYRSMSLATKQVDEKQQQEQKTRILNRQMETLHEQNDLMRKNQEEVSELRRNLSETYHVIENLLAKGKKDEAMKFIQLQADLLNATQIKVFYSEPLINAALSIYFRRAEEIGIKVFHKIDMLNKKSVDESDLAVLLSNLLENAITAIKKQEPPMSREISVILRQADSQNILEISNSCNYYVNVGENDLPYTTEIGHGLGMSSLEIFAKKYNAFVDFTQENDVVTISVYWNTHL